MIYLVQQCRRLLGQLVWSIWKDLECPGRLYSRHTCTGLYYVSGFGRVDLNYEWGHILHRVPGLFCTEWSTSSLSFVSECGCNVVIFSGCCQVFYTMTDARSGTVSQTIPSFLSCFGQGVVSH